MAKEITIPYKFEPRWYQLPFLQAADSGKYKRFFLCWHRRGGKDKLLWNFIIKRATEVVGQHYYLFPTYTQAKKILWDGIDNDGMPFLDHVPPELLAGKPNDTELQITLKNDSIIQLVGTDNYDSIRGTNPKTCIFSEFAFQDPGAWDVVRPILKLNGGLAVFNTTPNGENHAHDLWKMAEKNENWWTQLLTIDDTKLLNDEDLQEERDEGMSEEMVQQEYYCKWNSAAVGSYYGSYMRAAEEAGRIGKVPWDELRPVVTFWDLGMNDTMVIGFFQQHGFTYKLIDSYYSHGKGLEHYAGVIKDKPYKYATHYVPHDAKNRDMNTGLERAKTLDALLQAPVVTLPRPKSVQDKIEASRWILPKVYIDSENCDYVVKALKNYKQEYDEKLKIWKKEPLHDWSSHPADMFAYFALFVRETGQLVEYEVSGSDFGMPFIPPTQQGGIRR